MSITTSFQYKPPFPCLDSGFRRENLLTQLQTLIISVHGRYSARILQAHVDTKQRFVIRASRLIKLTTLVVNSEVELLLRWQNPRPIGETQQQPSDDDSVLPPNTTLSIRCAVPGQALQQALTV